MLENKLNKLKKILSDMGSVIIAYSGGVDSAFLLKAAVDVIKDKVIAVIGKSAAYPVRELNAAIDIANKIGARYRVIETKELSDENFASNPSNRCYYCKSELFTKLLDISSELGYKHVIEGSNADDNSDFRPGLIASCELGIRRPLEEAGLKKNEIRMLARELGLSVWDKPSQPCLSSRIPYGTGINEERLRMIDDAEQFLFNLGLKQFRVRFHNDLARIEVLKNDFEFILKSEITDKIIRRFKEIGFTYTTLDLLGYRMGSMNESLKNFVSEEKSRDACNTPCGSSKKNSPL